MVDPKSYETAEAFLASWAGVDEALTMQLAQEIQDTIEDWINQAQRQGLIHEELDPDRLHEDRDDRLEAL